MNLFRLDIQQKTILKANLAGFYRLLGKHSTGLEIYQTMEKELDEMLLSIFSNLK